jgi:ZIP family zinc transporter
MLSAGWPRPKITRLWVAVCGLSVLAAALGYLVGSALTGLTGAGIDAFAAGALLVMLTDSMIPESFEHGGREAGLALVLGFAVAVGISLLQAAPAG